MSRVQRTAVGLTQAPSCASALRFQPNVQREGTVLASLPQGGQAPAHRAAHARPLAGSARPRFAGWDSRPPTSLDAPHQALIPGTPKDGGAGRPNPSGENPAKVCPSVYSAAMPGQARGVPGAQAEGSPDWPLTSRVSAPQRPYLKSGRRRASAGVREEEGPVGRQVLQNPGPRYWVPDLPPVGRTPRGAAEPHPTPSRGRVPERPPGCFSLRTASPGMPCSGHAAPAGSCSPVAAASARAGSPQTTRTDRLYAPAAADHKARQAVRHQRPAPRPSSLPPPRPAGPAAPRPPARRPAPCASPAATCVYGEALGVLQVYGRSRRGSVMLLSRLSPLLPLPLAPHSAILKVPGQPHQPWRYMRIYLTAKHLPRIDYANERPRRPRPFRRCSRSEGWREGTQAGGRGS